MTTDSRTIEYMPLAELVTRLHPQNPKSHDIGAIIESYKVHGYVASGVIDSRTGLFLAGHGRTIALNMMQKQGMDAPDGIRNGGDDWLVPVQVGYESKSDVQAKSYIVADNKLTIAGGWNEPALAELLQEVAGSVDMALSSTGFSGDELDDLLRDLGMAEEPPEDPGAQVDRAEELNKKWGVERGDVWQVGRHRIMCGDSTCAEDVEKLMGGRSPDAIVTDPPYGVGIDYKSIADDANEVRDIVHRFIKIALSYKCPTAITSGVRLLFDYPSPDWIMAWIHPAGNGMGPWGFTTFNPILIYGKDPYLANGLGSRSDSIVMTADRGGENIHPVTKPLNVWLWLIERMSINDNDLILDFFLGSGTTLVACHQTDRIGYGMEIHPPHTLRCVWSALPIWD